MRHNRNGIEILDPPKARRVITERELQTHATNTMWNVILTAQSERDRQRNLTKIKGAHFNEPINGKASEGIS